jgi:hypothetical protein
VLLRRLGVFAGRFTLEDVESVCTSDDVPAARALDLLSSLVDKSLVMREDAKGRACYRLHETMGEYTRLKLREAGEEDVVELRCADFYVSRCQRAAEQPVRYQLPEWLEWMELEIDNIRSVLRRCLNHADFPRGIGLACSVGWYWITRATSEGVRWLDELLASGPGKPALGGLPYFLRGFLAVLQSDPTAARPALARAVVVARDAGQLRLLAESLAIGSVAANMAGDRASARRLLDESQVVAEGIDDVSATLAFLQARSLNGFFEGDLDTVRASSSEGVRLSRETGDTYGLEMLLINLGSAALLARELDQAQPLFAEALRISKEIDDRVAQ